MNFAKIVKTKEIQLTQKSQWRLDAEERINKAKSPSQKYRHALFEFHQVQEANGVMVLEDFDHYYVDFINDTVFTILETCEEIMERKKLS